jgi:hypothetical protein
MIGLAWGRFEAVEPPGVPQLSSHDVEVVVLRLRQAAEASDWLSHILRGPRGLAQRKASYQMPSNNGILSVNR